MENLWKREYDVLTSLCDAEGRLGIRNIFDIFMDMAADHAQHLGVGYHAMLERRCYWVAVRTRVRLYERPSLGQRVTAYTWPGKPGLAKCDRFYRLCLGDQVLAEGRTEWASQDIDTGAVRRTDSFGYPRQLAHREEKVCAEPFTRFRGFESGPEEPVRHYTVGSMDIDVGRHMNNVAYIRMLLDGFSTEELTAMEVTEVEISYRKACFEGETLTICRRPTGEGWLFQVQRPEGEVAVQALLRLRQPDSGGI